MATSTGKTIGLILIVLFIYLIVAGAARSLLMAPLGIFPGAWHLTKSHAINGIAHSGPLRFLGLTSYSFLPLILLILWIAVVVWVYRDAEERGMNGVLWGLLVFIGSIIGLLIYLIVRSDAITDNKRVSPDQACPNCQKPTGSDFIFCPYCGKKMQFTCSQCDQPVKEGWKVCPHCGEKL